jgi:hypothetical protein
MYSHGYTAEWWRKEAAGGGGHIFWERRITMVIRTRRRDIIGVAFVRVAFACAGSPVHRLRGSQRCSRAAWWETAVA